MKLVKKIGNLILCAWFMFSSVVCMVVAVQTKFMVSGFAVMCACLFLSTYFAYVSEVI